MDSLDKDCEQAPLAPRRLPKHLNVSAFHFLVIFNLFEDLDVFGVSCYVGFIVGIMMNLLEHFPCFARSVFQAEIPG